MPVCPVEAGVAPGESFEVHFPVRQYDTYRYRSLSGMQEQLGHCGALVIDPAGDDPVRYVREHVIVLLDWTFEDPHTIIAGLKKGEGYFNFRSELDGPLRTSDINRPG